MRYQNTLSDNKISDHGVMVGWVVVEVMPGLHLDLRWLRATKCLKIYISTYNIIQHLNLQDHTTYRVSFYYTKFSLSCIRMTYISFATTVFFSAVLYVPVNL